MSKKHKKFKKKFKAEILSELGKIQEKTPENKPITFIGQKTPVPGSVSFKAVAESSSQDIITVRSDLIKIGLIFAGFVILLVVLYFIGLKTSLLADLADFLTNALHIS